MRPILVSRPQRRPATRSWLASRRSIARREIRLAFCAFTSAAQPTISHVIVVVVALLVARIAELLWLVRIEILWRESASVAPVPLSGFTLAPSTDVVNAFHARIRITSLVDETFSLFRHS